MPQKVLMVLEGDFPPDDRVYKEAKSLINEGFSVTIACYTFTQKPQHEVFQQITIIRKRIPKLIYKLSVAALKFRFYFLWWQKYLESVLRHEAFDIIHIHDLPLAKVGSFIKKKYGLKLVVDLHENWPAHLSQAKHTNTFFGKILSDQKKWRTYEAEILHSSNLIICVVEEMKERIVKLGYADEKVIVLPNTIDPLDYKLAASEKQNGEFVLFFAGGITIERGLQYVIPAIAKLIDKIPTLKLKIVGTGSYLNHLKILVDRYNLNQQIEFLGWKPLKDVIQMTCDADVALIPHLKWEQTDCSSPNKLFQCMYAKVPLIVSNCNSVERIVLETQSGVSYVYNNINELADKILYLYKRPEVRLTMAENGNKAVLSKYNWNNTATTLIEAYKNL
ncbi:MAG: glycosyltransferase family 4 protein [Salinivirgaceae bacterium]